MKKSLSEFYANRNLAEINFFLCKEFNGISHAAAEETNHYYHPENHKHDGVLAEWFLTLIKYNDAHHPLVITTNNDTMINIMGQLIERRIYDTISCKVFIFEGDSVIESTFDENGVLQNFPFGWFMYDYDIVEKFKRLP